MITDINEIKANEDEITKTKNRLKTTLAALPDLLFEIGLDGQVYDYHSQHRRLIDMNLQVIVGKTIAQIFPNDVANICSMALQEASTT